MTTARRQAAALRFQAQLRDLQATLARRLDTVTREVAFDLAENIIVGGAYAPGTPVDTGFARASWHVGINTPVEPHQPPDNPGRAVTPLDPVYTFVQLQSVRGGDVVYLNSNTVYMRFLEFGSSAQAPGGFIRLTLNARDLIVRDAVQRARSGQAGRDA